MIRALLTLIFTASFIASSFFTTFTGFEANQLPVPQIDPPIQPAGYAFAIWGLIYGWLIVSAVFGFWRRSTDAEWDTMRTPLLASLILGTPWLWVATQSAIAATVLIFAMLGAAVIATLRAPDTDIWWAKAPVGLYAGWLTAASFVSLGSTMAGYGIGFDQTGWAFAGITMALLIALAVQSRIPDMPTYGLAVIWALQGIIAANGETRVSLAAGIGMILIAAFLVRQMRQELQRVV